MIHQDWKRKAAPKRKMKRFTMVAQAWNPRSKNSESTDSSKSKAPARAAKVARKRSFTLRCIAEIFAAGKGRAKKFRSLRKTKGMCRAGRRRAATEPFFIVAQS